MRTMSKEQITPEQRVEELEQYILALKDRARKAWEAANELHTVVFTCREREKQIQKGYAVRGMQSPSPVINWSECERLAGEVIAFTNYVAFTRIGETALDKGMRQAYPLAPQTGGDDAEG